MNKSNKQYKYTVKYNDGRRRKETNVIVASKLADVNEILFKKYGSSYAWNCQLISAEEFKENKKISIDDYIIL